MNTTIRPAGGLCLPDKCRVTLLALGDVGSTLLMGLRLLGGDVIRSIGICDVRPGVSERWEFELNQIQSPDAAALPPVDIIAPEQLAWLYKDLRALDPEIRQLVVACHVPLVANNGAWDDIWYNLKNKDELFVLLQDYDVTIMTGDWHTEGTTRVSDRIVEYVHPAVTGNWWYRQGICCNGYPAAFTEYVFRGDRLESRSLIDWANGNSKQQYRVYNKGVTSNTGIASSSALDPAGGAPSVLVFFWGVAPNWTFVCRENGELTYGRGQLGQRYDPLARSLVEEGIIPYERYTWLKQKPVRLYLYTPKDPGAEIEIVGTDHIRNRDFRVVTRIER